jgi:hypothetical protein
LGCCCRSSGIGWPKIIRFGDGGFPSGAAGYWRRRVQLLSYALSKHGCRWRLAFFEERSGSASQAVPEAARLHFPCWNQDRAPELGCFPGKHQNSHHESGSPK